MTFNPPSFTPPVLAVGQADRQNGRQQLGSGLVTHRGLIDSNSLRAQGALYPQSGAGLELMFSQSPPTGYVRAYDRDTASYLDLNIFGKNIVLGSFMGGKVTLPQGSAQALIGSYRQVVNWSIPATSAWYESPAQTSFTSLGGLQRIEACGAAIHSVAAAIVYIGLMFDGAASYDSLTAIQPSIANQLVPFSVVAYYNGATPGPHRWAVMLYSPTAGGGLWGGGYTNLWVTEQRA